MKYHHHLAHEFYDLSAPALYDSRLSQQAAEEYLLEQERINPSNLITYEWVTC